MDYDAFVSYRRSDGSTAAHWLRGELERFRMPKRLAERYGRRKLRVYLDTAYERGTSDFYEHTILPALLSSRHLIVIATPDAVRRAGGAEDWIAREIADFTAGPNGGNVMVVRAAGPLGGTLPADLKERFPNIEIVDLRGAGRFWYLHPARAARLSNEKLKVIAPLFEVASQDMPILRQEEERAQQMRMGTAAGVLAAIVLAVSTLSVVAVKSQWQAQAALNTSLFAAGQMILSVSQNIDADGDASEVRGRLLGQACDLLDMLGRGASEEARTDALVACLTERGSERRRHNEPELAEQSFEEAVRIAESRYGRTRRLGDAYPILEAYRSLADFHGGRRDHTGLERTMERFSQTAEAITALHSVADVVAATAALYDRLGDRWRELDEDSRALGAEAKAAEFFGLAANLQVGSEAVRLAERQAELLYHLAAAHARAERPDDAVASYRSFLAVRDKIGRLGGETAAGKLQSATAHALIAYLAASQRRSADARSALEAARALVLELEEDRETDEELHAQLRWVGQLLGAAAESLGKEAEPDEGRASVQEGER